MHRTPPKDVLETLRKEVNFGCPVTNCGSTYLTWHHFDPPWGVKEHHNVEGMIALCPECAALADGNRWTKDQLKEMKKNPFVKLNQISANYGYLRNDVVCIVGNIAYNVKNVLEINGERVIWFNVDRDGYKRLNILIKDTNGQSILVMEDNFWTAITKDLFDLHCTYRGKVLEIISKDKKTKLYMRFDDYTLDEFRNKMMKLSQDIELPDWICEAEKIEMKKQMSTSFKSNVEDLILKMCSPESVSTWTIKGILQWGGVSLKITDLCVINLVNHSRYGINFVIGGPAAFSFSDKSNAIG